MTKQLERFITLLKGIFELDKSDLDFGIYRIMNIRKKEIEKFLTVGLPQKVQEALKPFATDTAAAEARIKEIETQLGGSASIAALPPTVPMVKEYAELKTQLAKGVDLSGLEADVYSHLYSFFNRYYEEGDFISKRRYKEGVYAIPYEGEEVKLYWANQDQYYIKTSENFKDYTFVAEGYNIHFKLVDATTEQNNNKESADNKRVFMLYTENPEQPELKTFEFDAEKKEFIIRFIFDVPPEKKFDYAADNAKKIVQWIATNCSPLVTVLLPNVSADPKKPLTLIEKHLKAYVAKNTFDYFIHKDLHKFLSRELDFYIKNEVMHLDDVDTPDEKQVSTYLAKIRAIKRVGNILIEFLSSIENFQKKLWIKKKFVVQCDYCITLDRIPEEFYPEIAANNEQREEWVKLCAIDSIHGDLTSAAYSIPLTIDFLKENRFLMVDTKFFSDDFKSRLLVAIDDLDKQCDGLLIHSENFQALNLLQERYKEKVKCVYIDPPYNTEQDRNDGNFIYKDNFENSSWLSLLNDRILKMFPMLKKDATFFMSIDHNEIHSCKFLLENLFGRKNFEGLISWRRRHNQPNDKTKMLGMVSEYILSYAKNSSIYKDSGVGKIDITGVFSNPDNDPRGDWASKPWKVGSDQSGSRYKITTPSGIVLDEEWMGEYDTYQQLLADNRIYFPKKTKTEEGYPRKKYFMSERLQEGQCATNWWPCEQFGHNQGGNDELTCLMGRKNTFSNPKPTKLIKGIASVANLQNNGFIFDFFAGSGATGHAVIDLTRQDEVKRKYILVDMGEHFNTVIMPRIKKVVFSPDWKDGKPESFDKGISHCFKYLTLESYEDALSNVTLPDEDTTGQLIARFGDEYLVKYMLNLNAAADVLNLKAFAEPFSYKLKVTEKNETKEVNVDLMETFNYLIGLTVEKLYARNTFTASPDPQGEYEGAVKLTPDKNGNYTFRQIEGKLPDGKRCLILWRSVTENLAESNAALDAYFQRYRINPADREYDLIYVNGDNNLENLKTDAETWKVRLIEPEFKKLMFEEE